MRVLSLFAGVGMFDYAWKQLGWETAAVVEIDPWCRKVLAKHYPEAKQYSDVRNVTYERLKEDGVVSDTNTNGRNQGRERISEAWSDGINRNDNESRPLHKTQNQPTGIDLICGGFPCQDLSVAGKQAGIEGERSGLWGEFARIISDIARGQGYRPTVVIENVSALLTGDGGRWFDRILIDLAEIGGYEVEWHCICAGKSDGTISAGAPHRRERVWIICTPVAYPGSTTTGSEDRQIGDERRSALHSGRKSIRQEDRQAGAVRSESTSGDAAHPSEVGQQRKKTWAGVEGGLRSAISGMDNGGQAGRTTSTTEPSMGLLAHGIAAGLSGSRWLPEPGVGRVATGVPDRVNKLEALGNGLVWQIPYAIGLAIEDQK